MSNSSALRIAVAHKTELSAPLWFVSTLLLYLLSYFFAPGLYGILSLKAVLPWYAAFILVVCVILLPCRWFARGGHFDGQPMRLPENSVAVVTGAGAGGIGFESAVQLAQRGALVYILIRGSDSRGNQLQHDIASKAAVSKERIRYVNCDLGSFESILKCGKEIYGSVDHIDVLLNNAAVFAVPNYSTTVDGFELQMGTNHFGHFLLTSLLLPKLQRSVWSHGGRVVNVASHGHLFVSEFDWTSSRSGLLPANYEAFNNYGLSKLGNIYFTLECEKRFGRIEKADDSNAIGPIHSFAAHPGMVISELGRHVAPGANANKAYFRFILRMFMKTPFDGCQTQLYCSISNDRKLVGGEYYQDCTFGTRSPLSRNEHMAKQFWEWSEQETAKVLQNILKRPVAPSFHTFHTLIATQGK